MNEESRRRFILKSASAVAAPLLGNAVAAQPAHKLGFALCGLGNLSEHFIAPALKLTGRCRLAGVITGSPDKARAWQAKYGIPARSCYTYDSMHQMADNPDIDVVYVVTPNALHAENTIAAAAAGKHVFCEKPMEVSVEKCVRMIAACNAARRRLAVAYRCQYDPNNLECMRLARSRQFGDVHLVQASFGHLVGPAPQWRLKRALAGGGALMDVGIYALQATCYLTGETPIEVSAIEGRTDPIKFAQVEESVTWLSRFPGGVLASCNTSYSSRGLDGLRVDCARGWFELDPAFLFSHNHGQRSDGQLINLPSVNQFAAEMDDFARCIVENSPSRVSGEMGLRDVRIMMAIYKAARTGKTVKVV